MICRRLHSCPAQTHVPPPAAATLESCRHAHTPGPVGTAPGTPSRTPYRHTNRGHPFKNSARPCRRVGRCTMQPAMDTSCTKVGREASAHCSSDHGRCLPIQIGADRSERSPAALVRAGKLGVQRRSVVAIEGVSGVRCAGLNGTGRVPVFCPRRGCRREAEVGGERRPPGRREVSTPVAVGQPSRLGRASMYSHSVRLRAAPVDTHFVGHQPSALSSSPPTPASPLPVP